MTSIHPCWLLLVLTGILCKFWLPSLDPCRSRLATSPRPCHSCSSLATSPSLSPRCPATSPAALLALVLLPRLKLHPARGIQQGAFYTTVLFFLQFISKLMLGSNDFLEWVGPISTMDAKENLATSHFSWSRLWALLTLKLKTMTVFREIKCFLYFTGVEILIYFGEVEAMRLRRQWRRLFSLDVKSFLPVSL